MSLIGRLTSDLVSGGGGVDPYSSATDLSQIVSTTKPVTRVDGSALAVGDRWYKDDEGSEWFWNGTYWLSQNLLTTDSYFNSSIVAPQTAFEVNHCAIPSFDANIFLENIVFATRIDGAVNDGSNYWNIAIRARYAGSTVFLLPSPVTFTTQGQTAIALDNIFKSAIATNQILSTGDGQQYRQLLSLISSVGSPSRLSYLSLSFDFRRIAP